MVEGREQTASRLLANGMEALALPHDKLMLEKLMGFLRLLQKWNTVYNLTAMRDLSGMVSGHVLDSLAVHPYVKGANVIDVGTGGGLPGVPLALVSPEKHFVLLDRNAKKTRFVQQAVIELGLDNVTVAHARVEDYRAPERFDTVLARAFAGLSAILGRTQHLVKSGGRVVALKGRISPDEIQRVCKQPYSVIPLRVPGLHAERHVVVFSSAVSQA